MRVKQMMMMLSIGAMLAAGGGGCEREQAVATVKQTPEVEPPSTQEMEKERNDKLLAELQELPDLGPGVAFTTPDGELWNRYPSGILIHDLTPSDKVVPKLGQTVSIVYTGTYPGTNEVFDKNSANNPLVFKLGSKGVVKGLSMGLSTMHLGSKRRILVPSELAYGAMGQPAKIPPNQALIFEVELLAVSGTALEFPKAELPTVEPLGPALPDAMPATKPSGGL